MASTLVSEIVGHLKGVLRDPIFHLLIFFEAFELGLVLGEVASSRLSFRVEIPYTVATVSSELPEVFEFLGRRQQLDQSLMILTIVLSLQEGGALGLAT